MAWHGMGWRDAIHGALPWDGGMAGMAIHTQHTVLYTYATYCTWIGRSTSVTHATADNYQCRSIARDERNEWLMLLS